MKDWRDVGIDIEPGAHGQVLTTCPQCSGSRKKHNVKCLSVNTDDGIWLCHHCNWSGSLKSGEQSKSDPDPYGVAEKRPKVYRAPKPIPAQTTPNVWAQVVKWFTDERAIPEAVLARNHITGAREWCPVCEDFRDHILFPFYRDGQHINTKHRDVHKHFRMEKDAERILYGLPDVVGQKTIVIVEGEIDKLSCEVAGYPNCVSVPDGAPSPTSTSYASKFAFLESAKPVFDFATKIIIATDADAPGQHLQEELARRFGREKCWLVTWPDGIKDANECLKQTDSAELRRCLEAAEPYPVEGLISVDDIADRIEHLYDHGFDQGSKCGVGLRFDNVFRFRRGLMSIWTGIPGHGKSSFLDSCLVGLAKQGWQIGVCSPENQPLERHSATIIAKFSGQPFHDGERPRMEKATMLAGRAWLGDHFDFILPEEPTIEAILDRAKALVYRRGANMIVIDPWNELDHSRPPGLTETEYASQCLTRIRNFGRRHDCHMVLVAHPTKLKPTTDGAEPVPDLWDISGSANFRNKADAGVTVWRDIKDDNEPTQVHVTKIRFQETGKRAVVEFRYDLATGVYSEVP